MEKKKEDKGPNWEKIRKEEFSLSCDYVYMNNSTFGATLKSVQEGMNDIKEIFAEGCNVSRYIYEIVFKLKPIREKMLRLINSPEEGGYLMGFVNSVTEGMSLVANGITFKEDDTILITDHEHPGGKSMWELQKGRYKTNLIEVPLIVDKENEKNDKWKDVLLKRFREEFEKCYRENRPVKVISFSWCTCSTGHILPAKELCSMAHEYGAISVVDAAQSWAVIPIDISEIECDFMVMNGHKYLCGPIGSGFIVVNPKQTKQFWPTVADNHNYDVNNHPYNFNPNTKGGVAPYTNILPLINALGFYEKISPDVVYKRLLHIGQWLRGGLSMYKDKFEVITPLDSPYSCIMTCFQVNGVDSQTVSNELIEKYNIHIRYADEGGADAVRLSPHYYNTEEEFMRLVNAICKIASVDVKDWPPFPG